MLESPQSQIKKRLQHRCFLVSFMKIFKIYFLQNTSWLLLLTFHCNSLIKKYLSDVSTIVWLVFLVISQTNVYSWVYFSQRGSSLFLNTWNLQVRECHRKQFRLYYVKTSHIFYQEVLELWYLIGKKEFGEKWLNFGNVTNIFYRLFFTDQPFLPIFFWPTKIFSQFSLFLS